MQSGGGFVKHEKGFAGVAFGQFGGQLHALVLATRQRGRRLPELDVSKPDFLHYLQFLENFRLMLEELHGLIYGHIEHVGYGFSLETHFKRLTIVALSATCLTRHKHIGEEIHLDGLISVPLAHLTAASGHIE